MSVRAPVEKVAGQTGDGKRQMGDSLLPVFLSTRKSLGSLEMPNSTSMLNSPDTQVVLDDILTTYYLSSFHPTNTGINLFSALPVVLSLEYMTSQVLQLAIHERTLNLHLPHPLSVFCLADDN